MSTTNQQSTNYATFGGGCFWCIEAILQRLIGVIHVNSGYAGSSWSHPSYQEVCSGMTGHAEVCQIEYDPNQISYSSLLSVFFHLHDPTTINRQGNDIGTQYRSIILYHNEEQKEEAIKVKEKIASGLSDSIVTEIIPLDTFYKAEDYHQSYFNKQPNQSYCNFVIKPKVKKLKELFPALCKDIASS